ncbi:transporter, major facilitator family protein [Ancylostoma ceylanicum]|uniref:Transporter, major facilitator family protein n=1 Tax=Ancylostoma ceylanicum TaxID=53326 RepID=A0A0D6MDJ3_9BILA|nr:transporter, major facilitator family protein [Ancylostoma ceylanicum]
MLFGPDDQCFKVKAKCYADCPTCPDICSNFTLSGQVSCQAQHKPYFYSAAMEYEQYCDDFYRAFSSTTVQYLGVLLGNFFVGFLADKYGRRTILLLALVIGIPDLALSAVFVSLPLYYFFRFLVGISVAATMTVGWAYFAEMISARHRFKLRTFTSWTNGRLLMTALTQLAMTWRLATYYHASASLLALAVVFFLPESPLWLKRKGYFEREKRAQQKMAWIKGMEYKKEEQVREEAPHPQMSVLHVFKDAELRTSFLVLCVMWFFGGLSMYMIDLNGEDMTTNFWLGQYMSAALASIIRVIVGFADAYIPWLGRRKVYIIAMGTCILASVGLTAQLLGGGKGSTLYFITYLVAYNSISVSWEPNFLGAAELMPTDIYFKTIYEPAIMIVLMISNITSFVVTVTWLKETKNINLEGVGARVKPNTATVEKGSSAKSHSRSSRVRDAQEEKERSKDDE